jgi:hypothetical protein
VPIPTVTGQYLIDACNDLLAGYQNGVDSRALLTYLNMAKDEVWSVTKELHEEYFQTFSQNTNPSGSYYFPVLSTATREYTLPEDLRSIEYIECQTATSGGATAVFKYAKLNSPAFKEARARSNELGGPEPNNNQQEYIYTIAGQDQFVLASYPSQNYSIILWYTFALPDFEASDTLSEILFPFSKKLAEYAAKRAMIGLQDPGQFAMWAKEWRDSLINLVQGEGTRNDADAQFVEDFTGDGY